MMGYVYKMLDKLTSAYTRKDLNNEQPTTNIGKLFSLFAWGLDIVDNKAELVKLWDDMNNACGAVLDRYGANWGVKRFSESDELYRLAIQVKVLSQISGGDTDTVIRAAADLLGVDYSDIKFSDVFPAKIRIDVDWALLTQERKDLIEPIAYAIKRILAAGVGFKLYINVIREFRSTLNFNFGSYISTRFDSAYPPIGQDREYKDKLMFSFGSFGATHSTTSPVGQDRTSRSELSISHGAFLGSNVPQTKLALQPNGVSGVLYRTHIKPKRIE